MSGGNTTIANTETPVPGLQIQSSAYGLSLAFGYGRTRVKPNLLWYGDFAAVPHTSSQSSGGKGGGGVTQTSTTYTYTAAFALALGETVSSVHQVWIDKAAAEDVNIKFAVFLGPDPQSPWSYLTGAHPDQALGYSGIAYVAAAGYDFSNRTTLPNHTFDATLKLPLGGGVDDADPGQILPDVLTNTQYGVPNFPAARIGDLSLYSAYCRSAGLLLSPLYDQPQAASQIITNLMQLTNSGMFFSEGVLKVTPYGDTAVSAHGASYTPDLTTKADFTEDDFLISGTEDPVRVKRNAIPETVSGSADAYNQVTLEILDRSQDYRAVPIIAQDMVSIDAIGLRPMGAITAHEIADSAIGQAVANLILQRALNIRATYEWSAGWQWCRLEPTDIVSITEPALGMDGYPVRILTIEEDGETGGLKFTAEDVPLGIGHHVAAPTPTLGGYAVDQAIPPGPTNAPVIFEPPNSLTAPDLQLWVAASGGVNWGGCEVWASDDGVSYRRVGVVTNPARHGTLTTLLSAGSDPDTTHPLNLELSACRGQLLPGTTADADAHNTLLWVDGELIAYASATLTGSYTYSLGYLRRGIKGTANATHASGSKFVQIDDALFRYTIDRARIGSPIWLKFPAFNTQGFALQALASVSAYQYTFAGNRPLPVTSLSATGGMFQIALSWGFVAGQIDRDYTEIWGATSNNLAAASLLSSVKNPATAWVHPGLQPAQTWYYWARVVDTSGNFSDWYPSSTTGGIYAAPSADPSALLLQLNNSLGVAQLTADLNTKIELIDLTKLKGAFDNSIAAVSNSAEALGRANAILNEATARGAAITTESIIRQTAEESLANSITLLTASTAVSAAALQTEITTRAANDTAEATARTALAAQVNNATTGLPATLAFAQNEAATRATADTAEATARTALAAQVNNATTGLPATLAFAQNEAATRATADTAEATARTALAAVVASGDSTNAAAIVTEAAARATAISAAASVSTQLQARLDSGDYAAVKTQSSVTANRTGALEAKSTLRLDVNGYVSGMESVNNGVTSSLTVLADKFLFAKPDGSGTPIPVVSIGTLGGVSALGLNGNLIIDGSIVARSLAAASITADKIAAGTITADKLAAKTITAASGVIGDLAVDTLQIAGNAVTIPSSISGSSYGTTMTVSLVAGEPVYVSCLADGGGVRYDPSIPRTANLYINGGLARSVTSICAFFNDARYDVQIALIYNFTPAYSGSHTFSFNASGNEYSAHMFTIQTKR